MATFKVKVFQHQKRRDGKYPVSIRLTWLRQSVYMPTHLYVGDKQLNRSGEIKDAFMLRELNNRVARYEEELIRMGLSVERYSARELSARLLRKSEVAGAGVDFYAYAEKERQKLLKDGQESTAKHIFSTVNSLKKFCGDKLAFQDITVKLLKEYERWLLDSGVKSGGSSEYMVTIRKLFNLARTELNDDDTGDIAIANYPFKRYKMPKQKATKKRALPVETIRKIRDLELHNRLETIARDAFMLSFYLVGMNSVDLYRCPKAANGRLTYERSKTRTRRTDKAEISIKVEPEAAALVERYADPRGERCFSFYLRYKSALNFNISLNDDEGLKRVGRAVGVEGLTFYAARHSWATIARNSCGISKPDVSEALNHVDAEMKVTDIYIEKDWSRIDRANRAVLDLLKAAT